MSQCQGDKTECQSTYESMVDINNGGHRHICVLDGWYGQGRKIKGERLVAG